MEFSKSGIVGIKGWLLVPDGSRANYFWCANWRIVTDKQIPIEGFKSVEKWQLLAIVYEKELKSTGEVSFPKEEVVEKVVAIIPGCQVEGFIACDEKPKTKECYCFE